MLCADVNEQDHLSKVEITKNLEDDHGHSDSDLCSPFCICQCCQINIVSINFLTYTISSQELYAPIFSKNNGIKQDVSYSILQPPQA